MINHAPFITIFMGCINHQKWVVDYCYTHIFYWEVKHRSSIGLFNFNSHFPIFPTRMNCRMLDVQLEARVKSRKSIAQLGPAAVIPPPTMSLMKMLIQPSAARP